MRCPKCDEYVDDNDNPENGFFCIKCNLAFRYDGTTCPSCGSEDIAAEGIDPEGSSEALRKVSCTLCLCTWTEVFKVVGFIDLIQG